MRHVSGVCLGLALVVSSACGGAAKAGEVLHFQTGGYGVFAPANLGVGDPASDPTIIGDGSGLAVYDGTPTGNEFRLDGQLVGDGWDQHFGAAQGFTSGIPSGDVLLYAVRTAANPIRPGRRIHIMKTRIGEVWFQYTGYFTLDPFDGPSGTLIGRGGFQIVGGTRKFAGASGWVYVETLTHLADVFPNSSGDLSAPFRYDFEGWIRVK